MTFPFLLLLLLPIINAITCTQNRDCWDIGSGGQMCLGTRCVREAACTAGKYCQYSSCSSACPSWQNCPRGCVNCPRGYTTRSPCLTTGCGCTSCASGKYNNGGSDSCKFCSAGKYSSSGSCYQCQAGKTSSRGSGGAWSCYSLPINCVGAWSTCQLNCKRTYTHPTIAQHGGTACGIAAGIIEDCAPGVGLCPSLPTCQEFIATGIGTALCVDGTNHLKSSPANIVCATTTCSVAECCDANPTCNNSDCVEGTDHLIESPESMICATGTCTTAECCVTNPTCDNIDGEGTAFVSTSCSFNKNYFRNDLSVTCATKTCAAMDCCTVECYPPIEVAALEVRVVSSTTDFTGVEAIVDDDYEIESADYIQYRLVWESQPCGSTVNVVDIAFGDWNLEELPLLKDKHLSAEYDRNLVEPPDFFDGTAMVCQNVASGECNIVINAESIAPDTGEESMEFALDLGYESALEGSEDRGGGDRRRLLRR